MHGLDTSNMSSRVETSQVEFGLKRTSGGLIIVPIVPWDGAHAEGGPGLPYIFGGGGARWLHCSLLIYSEYSPNEMKSVSDDAVSKNSL